MAQEMSWVKLFHYGIEDTSLIMCRQMEDYGGFSIIRGIGISTRLSRSETQPKRMILRNASRTMFQDTDSAGSGGYR